MVHFDLGNGAFQWASSHWHGPPDQRLIHREPPSLERIPSL